MTVKLNDKVYNIDNGATLAAFIEEIGVARNGGVAVAINYEVIPKNRWHETILTDNTEIMLIHAVSGG
ncbi:MAG: sulfur carrier protein ThiS [Cytophagaceae bacterium]|jgi:sulfur carrier protein|nr:sulfur carrier protein ThiS [Cytophagaceae bacterium]